MVENMEETKECNLCKMTPLLLGIGVAHTACDTLDDPEKKRDCNIWADGINPEEMKDAKEIFKGTYQRVGIGGIDKVSKVFNVAVDAALSEEISDKIKRGETLSEDEQLWWKGYLARTGGL